MAFCRVVFPLLVLSVIGCYATKPPVPVYMWGDLPHTSLKASPLSTVSTLRFEEIVKEELADDPLVIVFIEETLSVEDFSRKDAEGEISFPYLHKTLRKSMYLPSVRSPLHALHLLAAPHAATHIKLTKYGLSEEIDPQSSGNGRVVFVQLDDVEEDESRFEMLKRHDQFMVETIEKMPKNKPIVAVYTAHKPSWTIPMTLSRSRRAVETSSRIYALDGLRLFAKSIALISNNNTVNLNGLTSHKTEFNTTTMNTTMTFDNQSITLNFHEDTGYWFFDTVVLTIADLTEELYANDEVFAIMGFSYRCQQYISFSSVNETKSYTLRFEDLKIQPYFEPTNATTEFGDSFNCVGFFSAPIWSGLFVVFILLIITFYGIMMMMDIRTMDRFDDPKGKTITINAGE